MQRASPALLFATLGVAACSAPLASPAPPPGTAQGSAADRGGRLPPPLEPARRATLEEDLRAAQLASAVEPDNEDAAIWVGRRLAYLGRFDEAIAWYTRAIERFGATPKLLRHRGHRYITVRRFELAEADLALASELFRDQPDQIEPDGIVTAAGPRSTLRGNIEYHLGLARFAQRRLDGAATSWTAALAAADNDDSRVSAAYWLSVTLFEAGRAAMARAALADVHAGMDVRDNQTYLSLCLALRGEISSSALTPKDGPLGLGVDRATLGFGLAMCARHVEGDEARARKLLRETAALPEWTAFGVVAAESVIAASAARAAARPSTAP